MLCCLGLFAGFALGSTLGDPWTLIGPAIGFGLGVLGDIKLVHGSHGNHKGLGGGCCGGTHTRSEKIERTSKDPVSSMEVDETTAQHKIEFRGKTYYFCSSVCEAIFKKNWEKYINGIESQRYEAERLLQKCRILQDLSFLPSEKSSVVVLQSNKNAIRTDVKELDWLSCWFSVIATLLGFWRDYRLKLKWRLGLW